MDSGAEDNYQKKERTVLFDLKGLSDAMNSLNIQVSPKDLKNPSVCFCFYQCLFKIDFLINLLSFQARNFVKSL